MLLGSYTFSGYAAVGMDVVNGIAYLAYYSFDSSTDVAIINVQDPAQLTLRASYATPGQPVGVRVVDSLAYIAYRNSSRAAMHIIDVSNPSLPMLRGTYETSRDEFVPNGIDVANGFAYIAFYSSSSRGATSGIQIIDVHNPAAPEDRETPSDITTQARGIDVVGTLAYIANGKKGIGIWDVSDPTQRQSRGAIDTPGDAYAVQVFGNYAYVADATGLQVIGISDPLAPTIVGSYATPGSIVNVQVVNDLVYAAAGYGGLRIIDVAQPTNPVLRSSYMLARENVETSSWLSVNDVDVVGTTAYIAFDVYYRYPFNGMLVQYGGLEIVDIHNPDAPSKIGNLDLFEYAVAVQVVGKWAYVLDRDRGLQIIDVSNPAAPRRVGGFDYMGIGGYSVDVVDSIAYVTSQQESPSIIDVSNPAAPAIIGETYFSGEGIQVVGERAYVVGGKSLGILDVSNPATPVQLGFARLPDEARDVDIVGSLAYVADYHAGLQVVDISNPARPVVRGSLDTPGYALKVDVADDLAYVAGEAGGLEILGVSPRMFGATAVIAPSGGTLMNHDGSVRLDFPAGAVANTITVTYTGTFTQSQMLPLDQQIIKGWNVVAQTSTGQPVTKFNTPYTMESSYGDSELSAHGLDEATLNIVYWNGTQWILVLPCAGCRIDTEANKVIVQLDHLTEFALVGKKVNKPTVFLPFIQR